MKLIRKYSKIDLIKKVKCPKKIIKKVKDSSLYKILDLDSNW